MKYVLIVGSVMSGIGKGTVASSIGVVLKKAGYLVTAIKIDPYLNLDSGTMSPFEHGECYVLEDGGETDLDLGNYERFLHVDLTRDHNITTGKIYQRVLTKERRGDYLGKTVQIVPHITDEIKEWIQRTALIPITNNLDASQNYTAEICLIELGGTVGDLESGQYTEALRQFRKDCGPENFFVVNVCYLPNLRGELKTKPAQNGLAQLRECGLDPDLLVVRSEPRASETICQKLANVCNMPRDRIIMNEDLGSIYRIPILFSELGVDRAIQEGLHLDIRPPATEFWLDWQRTAERHCKGPSPRTSSSETGLQTLRIAIIGKYTGLSDSYLSLTHAIKDAAAELEVYPDIHFIEAGVDLFQEGAGWDLALIPGGFGTRGTEAMIDIIRVVRERNIPTLGICLGFQLMVIEWCRNVLGLKDAISEEVVREMNTDADAEGGGEGESEPIKGREVICHLSRDCPEELMGGTMKLGIHPVRLTPGSQAQKVFSRRFPAGCELNLIAERFRHRYGLAPEWSADIERSGLLFTGINPDGIGQICEAPDRKWYIGVQFHPEYRTRPLWPHVLFLSWIEAGLQK